MMVNIDIGVGVASLSGKNGYTVKKQLDWAWTNKQYKPFNEMPICFDGKMSIKKHAK